MVFRMLPELLTDDGGGLLAPSLAGGGGLFLNLRCVREPELPLRPIPIPIPTAGGSDAVDE